MRQLNFNLLRHTNIKTCLMKKIFILTLSIFTAAVTIENINAQVLGFAISAIAPSNTTNYSSCDSTVTMNFSAVTPVTTAGTVPADINQVIVGSNAFQSFQFQAQVNWGDGTAAQTQGAGVSSPGTIISFPNLWSHTYNSAGTYMITTTVYNPANQTYAMDSINYTVGICPVSIYSNVQVDCDNNGTIDSTITNVPLILSNGNNSYSVTSINNLSQFPGVQTGTYSLNVDPVWLSTHGYAVTSIVPSMQIQITNGGAYTFIITLQCAQTTTTYNCVGGQVYCDTDNNGVYSAGDIGISNAPVTVSSNGVNTLVYTNNQGYYTATYVGIIGQTAVVSLNQNWMVNNGYTAGTWPLTVVNVQCNSGLPIATASFPMNCGTTTGTTNCYSGYVFCDANGNGIMDNSELPLMFVPINLYNQTTMGSSSVTVYTDSSGYFTYCGPVSVNNYIIAAISQTYLGYNGYTISNNIITLMGGPTANIGYFAVNCGGTTSTCSDLYTTVSPWIGYYQNTTGYIHINWGSYGPGVVGPYQLTLTYPAGVVINPASISNSSYTTSGNTITWNLNATTASFASVDYISFSIPSGLASGTMHYFSSTITPMGNMTDCFTGNNSGTLLQIVGNSYDPNDKIVARELLYENTPYTAETIDAAIQDVLTYTINFQNTGTAPAQNIYVIDTLDANLDWNSLYVVESSHDMQVVNLGNGVMRFEFPQIWLDDATSNETGSHGHFTYRIQENASNWVGSTIDNTAFIYFDWNTPIITSTTHNVNTMLWGIDENNQNDFNVYPNPAQDKISIVGSSDDYSYSIFDMSGRALLNGKASSMTEQVNLSLLNQGAYLIKINNNNHITSLRFIKQ